MTQEYTLSPGDSVTTGGGPLFKERTEDGYDIRCNYFIALHLHEFQQGECGRIYEYVHPEAFRYQSDAEAFALKIRLKGRIDPSLWIEVNETTDEERYYRNLRDLEDERNGLL